MERARLAPAKLNLTLQVRGVRGDGYHELESLVTRIDFCDIVHARRRDDGVVKLACGDPSVPADDTNLAVRAARALAGATGCSFGADLRLEKHIPAGAGLGGGSSDAAAVLLALNDQWELGLGRAELARIAADLGSDVPLFLHDPLCVIRGRGERVQSWRARLEAWVTLLLPAVHCATPAVYSAYDRGARPAREVRPRLAALRAALRDVPRLMDLLYNDLEPAAYEVAPELRALAQAAAELAGGPFRLTGSGAALFRLEAEEGPARKLAASAGARLGVRAEVVRVQMCGTR